MTREEYLMQSKTFLDARGLVIQRGDTVVIKNHWGRTPTIGIVDHFTGNENVVIHEYYKGKIDPSLRSYRRPQDIIKVILPER